VRERMEGYRALLGKRPLGSYIMKKVLLEV